VIIQVQVLDADHNNKFWSERHDLEIQEPITLLVVAEKLRGLALQEEAEGL